VSLGGIELDQALLLLLAELLGLVRVDVVAVA